MQLAEEVALRSQSALRSTRTGTIAATVAGRFKNWLISDDIQSRRMTRFCQSETCQGGWKSEWDKHAPVDFINNYITQSAMRRLGT